MSDNNLICPQCESNQISKNGKIHNGKQNYRWKNSGRQFIEKPQKKSITKGTKKLIDRLLLEKISLAGIARGTNVSEKWLQDYVNAKYNKIPREIKLSQKPKGKLTIQCDEAWSFVGNKDNKKWIWLALDVKTKEIERGSAPNLVRHAQVSFVGAYIGDRSEIGARGLWNSLPSVYRQCEERLY